MSKIEHVELREWSLEAVNAAIWALVAMMRRLDKRLTDAGY